MLRPFVIVTKIPLLIAFVHGYINYAWLIGVNTDLRHLVDINLRVHAGELGVLLLRSVDWCRYRPARRTLDPRLRWRVVGKAPRLCDRARGTFDIGLPQHLVAKCVLDRSRLRVAEHLALHGHFCELLSLITELYYQADWQNRSS